MHFLFILDRLDTLNLATETSLLLVEELARRGQACSFAGVDDLSLSEQGASVRSRSIAIDLTRRPFYRLGPFRRDGFAAYDLVLMRKDPPIDESYVFATHVLERAAAEVPVVNHPLSLRQLNEKLLPLRFPQWTPPTLVSADADELSRFAGEHGRIVLKPLSECSGRGIRLVDASGAADAIRGALAERRGSPLLAQKFLAGVAQGDKRILVLDGEPLGAVNRIPQSSDHLANIHQGARVERTEITDDERAVVAGISGLLRRHGICLAGLDFIDGYLTEINITSPSALRQINAVSGVHLEVAIVDFLEGLAAAKQCHERMPAID